MKTKVLPFFACLILTYLLFSFSDPYTIKRISDANFRYEFYTTDKKVRFKPNVFYYWFKGGLIHSAQSGMAGELLNDSFTKMYHSNQLAERGQFNEGMKTGQWTSWYPNGNIAVIDNWYNGLRYGKYFKYDENGTLLETGKYRKGLKTGDWIDGIKKDTITYKKGIVFIKAPELSKAQKYKLQQDNRKAEEAKKAQQQEDAAKEEATLAGYKAIDAADKEKAIEAKRIAKEKEKADREAAKSQEGPNKKSKIKAFFRKLFSKKEPKQEPKPKVNDKGA